MLHIQLYSINEQNIEEAFAEAGFTKAREGWFLDKKLSKKRESVLAEKVEDGIRLKFSGDLSFEDYEAVHGASVLLAEGLKAEVDDSGALMGYLESGEKACLYHQWKKWKAYLLKAKHRSMEGQKVEVSKESGTWSGLLMEYTDKIVNDEHIVTECVLLSTDGEVRVQGNRLAVKPTGEFI
ncbi:hypothetical protein [Alkalicoccus saliphilus]|uniref:Uncharacterized protein n=1 Tax=Alkalicoccus saliphilus TaxID=200989 RepID=A0A2T4U5S9_9BACI|nr:hypothetical protein [Alkalicoccus saliphilus]PTL38756.1 hypothetical protein C6Y45_09700 [Alkalicoccus saliphilus]